MRFREKTVDSVQKLLRNLSGHRPASEPVWFRGQSKKEWQLLPSLARIEDGLERESMLSKQFRQHALALVEQRPQTEWEWLFVMQHHGVPTRLLDWSENPLAALYFAASENVDDDGAMWCLLPVGLNKEANIDPELENDLPGFDHEEVLKQYLPESLRAERGSRPKPVAAIAARNTSRMQAQAGAFTVCHRNLTPIEDIGDQRHVWRYTVPRDKKKRIIEELKYLNITPLSLFPELSRIGDVLRQAMENEGNHHDGV